jgi:hypothetical protein
MPGQTIQERSGMNKVISLIGKEKGNQEKEDSNGQDHVKD